MKQKIPPARDIVLARQPLLAHASALTRIRQRRANYAVKELEISITLQRTAVEAARPSSQAAQAVCDRSTSKIKSLLPISHAF